MAWIPSVASASDIQRLNTLEEMHRAIQACVVLPPLDEAYEGMEITVQYTFTRNGEILGEPRFTYMTPSAPKKVRAAYQRAIAEALSRCTPLPFTPELGNAVAGRPTLHRFKDTRVLPHRERRA